VAFFSMAFFPALEMLASKHERFSDRLVTAWPSPLALPLHSTAGLPDFPWYNVPKWKKVTK
jgi:hypothetical protein